MTFYDNNEHVFIIGSARSGTSLLASILQNSPSYASYHAETKLLRECETKYGRLSSRRNRQNFFRDWLKSRQFKRSGLSEAEAAKLLDECDSYICFLSAYMGAVASKQGCERWVDSTPDNVYALDKIMEVFPEAKVIHMVRDGRAVAFSLAKLGWAGVGTDDFDKALLYSALKWDRAVNQALKYRDSAGNRLLQVHYEDFVERPEKKLTEICDFLGIDYIDNMMMEEDANTNSFSTLHTPNSPFADLSAGISTAAVNRWKKLLSINQKNSLDGYIGCSLRALGYENISENISLYSQVLSRARRVNLLVRNILKTKTLLGRLSASPLEIGMD